MNWNTHFRIQQSGGILEESALPEIDANNIEDVKTLFSKLVQRLLNDELIDNADDIDLLLIDQQEIAAFVVKGNQKHAICLSIGTIRAVWNLLLLSLADKETFLNYPGDDKVDYEVAQRFTKELLTGPSITPSLHYPHDFERPKVYQNITAERLEAVGLLYNAIIDYILHHEAMHITRQHPSYFNALNNETFIDETTIKQKALQVYQFFEIDADLAALGYNITSHPEFKEPAAITEFERKDFFFSELFCYVLVQQLFDLDTAKEINSQLKACHPPPVFRAMFFSNLLRQYFRKYAIIAEEDIFDQQNKAWYESSRIAVKLGFPEGRWHGSHMNDVPFALIDQWVDEFNVFQEMIDIEDQAESLRQFKAYLDKEQ
ncbi:hypothetical protein [Paraflavitalea sp. CAU 1676]|uniref:hypothetical protein n=1 Tax=Paraflavitalea sp. CAU 1676 TaxID=3032598 RepID=UPI0023DA0155|nr:hypothetical protein [Paraflavitalea sp. CAU 1676]MDF2190361.1 hypothetical protein [Paraflavitalea sp. CAU 1676]